MTEATTIDPATEEKKSQEAVYAPKRHIDLHGELAVETAPKDPGQQSEGQQQGNAEQPEAEGQLTLGEDTPEQEQEPASDQSLVDLLDVIRPSLISGLENLNTSSAYKLEFSKKQRTRIEELKEVDDRESLTESDKALWSRFEDFKRSARDRIPYTAHERKKLNEALDKLLPYLKYQITEEQSLAVTLVLIHVVKYAPHIATYFGYELPGFVLDALQPSENTE